MDVLMSELPSTTKKDRSRAIKIYGETLKRRRRERGITIIELVGRTGIRRENIEDVERGILNLTPTQKQRIKKFLRRQRII